MNADARRQRGEGARELAPLRERSTWKGIASRLQFQCAGWLEAWRPASTLVARWDVARRIRWWTLDRHRTTDSDDLRQAERRVHSQNGEDGILEEIFCRAGITNRFFVEIGASDGSENCTRHLAEQDWQGVWIEADPQRAVKAKNHAGPGVRVLNAGAHPANITSLLRDAAVPAAPDLVVLDIDGNDWWVLRELLANFRPRVLVAEYNSTYVPGQRLVERYRPNHGWDGTFRHGASLDAMSFLAHHSNMALVACDSAGVNAFFVAEELGQHFDAPGDIERHYVSPNFSAGPWGHPRSRYASRSMVALSLPELRMIRVTTPRRAGRSGHTLPGEPVFISATIHNGACVALTSGDPAPLSVALRWRDRGEHLVGDFRQHLPFPISAGSSRRVTMCAPAPDTPGEWQLTMTLVQEQVAWLSDLSGQCEVSIQITVDLP